MLRIPSFLLAIILVTSCVFAVTVTPTKYVGLKCLTCGYEMSALKNEQDRNPGWKITCLKCGNVYLASRMATTYEAYSQQTIAKLPLMSPNK